MLLDRLKYVRFTRNEIGDLLMISFVLSFMFTITYFRFEPQAFDPFLNIFFTFIFFLLLVFFSRLFLIKLVSCYNGFSTTLYQTYFDRFGLRHFDRLSYVKSNVEGKIVKAPLELGKRINSSIEKIHYYIQPYGGNFKGIPLSIFSIIIYIFTLGFIIFPSQWRFKTEKIPHLFVGTVHLKETEMAWIHPMSATGFRKSRVLFSGFLFYLVIGIVMKYVLLLDDTKLFGWLYFALFWIAIISLLPIPGTEGYDLWNFSRFSWISAITLIIFGMFAILVFDSFSYAILISAFAFVIATLVYLWKGLIG